MTEEISGVIFGVWFLIGAVIGFLDVRQVCYGGAGFTRAKNTVTSL